MVRLLCDGRESHEASDRPGEYFLVLFVTCWRLCGSMTPCATQCRRLTTSVECWSCAGRRTWPDTCPKWQQDYQNSMDSFLARTSCLRIQLNCKGMSKHARQGRHGSSSPMQGVRAEVLCLCRNASSWMRCGGALSCVSLPCCIKRSSKTEATEPSAVL